MMELRYLIGVITSLSIMHFILMICAKNYRTRYKQKKTGILFALLIAYNLLFWDLIPVYSAHKLYCEIGSGVQTFESPQGWLEANPSKKGRLHDKGADNTHRNFGGWIISQRPSDRLHVDVKHIEIFFGLLLQRHVALIDSSNQRPLLQMTDYYSNYHFILFEGGPEDRSIKFWMTTGPCAGDISEEFDRQRSLYREKIGIDFSLHRH